MQPPSRRDLRLASGLVLFAYVLTHLVNHALGIVSLKVAERGLLLAIAVWHSLPGTLLLYGAAALHLALAFAAIYARRTLRMPPIEVLRIALGLGIPLLLIGHAIGTRIAWEVYEESPLYSRVVWALWNTDAEGRQLALMVPGWLHGCLGLHIAFGRRGWYRRLRYPLFALALLVPVLAGIGFVTMAREVAASVAAGQSIATDSVLDAAKRVDLARLRDTVLAVYFAAIAAIFAAREIRALIERRSGRLLEIRYPQRRVRVPRGFTVLEASRAFHVPHQSMCGGRARCSTCRVQIVDGAAACPPPNHDEAATLARIGAAADVRLACQLRPEGDVAVVPLLAATRGERPAAGGVRERDVALVGVTWRNRAAMMRGHLPQDAVYAARAFADAVAAALRTEGVSDVELGSDRAIGVFEASGRPERAARAALAAAQRVRGALAAWQQRMEKEFGTTPRVVVAAHAGTIADVEVAFHDDRHRLIAGDAADVLQDLAAAPAGDALVAVVTREAARRAGLHLASLAFRDVARGGGAVVAVTPLPALAADERAAPVG